MSFLGWTTRQEAMENGFDHEGSYWGIPIYVKDVEGDFIVMSKWYPLEFLFIPMVYIEGFFRSLIFPYDEPVMQFKIFKLEK